VEVVQYTFTQQQYTQQHSENRIYKTDIPNNRNKHYSKNTYR